MAEQPRAASPWQTVAVVTCFTLLGLMVLLVVGCSGWFAGLTAGVAAASERRGMIVVQDHVQIPDRNMTPHETTMAVQLGAQKAYDLDDRHVVAQVGGRWYEYTRTDGMLVLKKEEKKQD